MQYTQKNQKREKKMKDFESLKTSLKNKILTVAKAWGMKKLFVTTMKEEANIDLFIENSILNNPPTDLKFKQQDFVYNTRKNFLNI